MKKLIYILALVMVGMTSCKKETVQPKSHPTTHTLEFKIDSLDYTWQDDWIFVNDSAMYNAYYYPSTAITDMSQLTYTVHCGDVIFYEGLSREGEWNGVKIYLDGELIKSQGSYNQQFSLNFTIQ